MPPPPSSDGRFKDRSELLDFLLEVSTVVSSTLDLDTMLDRIIQIVRNAIHFDIGTILLYSEAYGGLRVRRSVGLDPELVKELTIPLREGITGVSAATRQPVNSGDVRNEPRYLPIVDAVRSELAVPLFVQDRIVGVIDLQSTGLNAFTNEDVQLIQLIASRVIYAITNARKYRRMDRQNRTLRTLSQLSQEFSSILNLDALLTRVAQKVKGLIRYDSFSVYLYEEQSQLLRSRFSLRSDQRVKIESVPVENGITGAAVRERNAVRVEDVLADPRYVESTPGIRSEIAIPLLMPDRLVGIMDLESKRVGYFTEDHLQTLLPLAPLIASAVENARLYEELRRGKLRMETDLEAARNLQSSLLPKDDPGIPGLEIGINFRPAHEISGDVFDFFEQGNEYAIISIGDVSGKSAAAALYGAMVTGLLRTLAPRRRTPAELVTSLNDLLMERRVGNKYLTLLVARWNPKAGTLVMSNAAGIPPIIVRGKTLIEPHVEGFPLGLFPGREYDEHVLQTEPGDLVLLYSDGIQDQQDPEGKDYGTARLRAFLPSVSGLPARQIVEAVLADLDVFRQGVRIQDDQTLIALRVKGIGFDLAI
ncbi:MAG: GAF domain-containing protein [Acidobacteria bacterium]|nr:GAF domain-containing protein [Acidobacteriota bacterium]